MPADVLYRGYRIVSDVQEVPGIPFWKAKVSVVKPADASGVERVHPIITTAYFITAGAASEFILAEAQRWIDNDIETER